MPLIKNCKYININYNATVNYTLLIEMRTFNMRFTLQTSF